MRKICALFCNKKKKPYYKTLNLMHCKKPEHVCEKKRLVTTLAIKKRHDILISVSLHAKHQSASSCTCERTVTIQGCRDVFI